MSSSDDESDSDNASTGKKVKNYIGVDDQKEEIEFLEDIEKEEDDDNVDESANIDDIDIDDDIEQIHTKIVKVIPSNERVSSNLMNEYEYARLISLRAKQIAAGSKVFINDEDSISHLTNATEIAKKELFDKRSPLIVRRKIGDRYEYWTARELVIPTHLREI